MSVDEAEAAGGLVLRGKHCFICLNAYPYTSGHVMVLPYAHLDRLAALPPETAHEMMDLAQRTEQALERLYRPHGLNFGMNLGQAAGAGVAGHLHLHALPRWAGDTNFMTTVAETRVLRKIWDDLRSATSDGERTSARCSRSWNQYEEFVLSTACKDGTGIHADLLPRTVHTALKSWR